MPNCKVFVSDEKGLLCTCVVTDLDAMRWFRYSQRLRLPTGLYEVMEMQLCADGDMEISFEGGITHSCMLTVRTIEEHGRGYQIPMAKVESMLMGEPAFVERVER